MSQSVESGVVMIYILFKMSQSVESGVVTGDGSSAAANDANAAPHNPAAEDASTEVYY